MRLKQRERESQLNRKYHLEQRGTLYVSGMLKRKIKAGGVKGPVALYCTCAAV